MAGFSKTKNEIDLSNRTIRWVLLVFFYKFCCFYFPGCEQKFCEFSQKGFESFQKTAICESLATNRFDSFFKNYKYVLLIFEFEAEEIGSFALIFRKGCRKRILCVLSRFWRRNLKKWSFFHQLRVLNKDIGLWYRSFSKHLLTRAKNFQNSLQNCVLLSQRWTPRKSSLTKFQSFKIALRPRGPKSFWSFGENALARSSEQLSESMWTKRGKKFEIVFFIVFGVYGENLIFDKTVLAKSNVRCPKDQLGRLLFWKSYKVFLFRTLIKTISDPGEKNQKRWIKSLSTSSDMQWKAKTFVWMKFFAFSNLEMEHKNLGFLAKNYRLDCEKSNLRVPSYFRWKKTIKVKLFIFSGNWMKNRILGKIFFEVKFSQHSWRISLLFVQT